MHFSKIICVCLSGFLAFTNAAPAPSSSNELIVRTPTVDAVAAKGTIPSSVLNQLKGIRATANTAITTLIVGEIALLDVALGNFSAQYLNTVAKVVNSTLANVVSTVTSAENMIHNELVGVVVNATGPIPATVITDVKTILAATQANVQSLLQVELANVQSIVSGLSAVIMAIDGVVANILNKITAEIVTAENSVVSILEGVTIKV